MSAFLNLLYVTKATTNWTDKTFNSLLNFATLRICICVAGKLPER
jgi:hypothetical protein